MLQFALETLLADENVEAWTYKRDQSHAERQVAKSLKERVKESVAVVFLVSPTTLDGGASQWMELAYADAFGIETFVLMHHLTYKELQARERGVPPLLLAGHCNPAVDWRNIASSIRESILRNQDSDD